MKKPKAKSPILEAVHETASDLHRLGFIDKRKMLIALLDGGDFP